MDEITLSKYYEIKSKESKNFVSYVPLDKVFQDTPMSIAVGLSGDEKKYSENKNARFFDETMVDSLLSKYLTQLSLAEKYEKLVKDVSSKSAGLLVTMVAVFSFLVLLTAIFFGSIWHG